MGCGAGQWSGRSSDEKQSAVDCGRSNDESKGRGVEEWKRCQSSGQADDRPTTGCLGCGRQTAARGVDLWAVARLAAQPRSCGEVGGDVRAADGGEHAAAEAGRAWRWQRREKRTRCGDVEDGERAAGHVASEGGRFLVTGANGQGGWRDREGEDEDGQAARKRRPTTGRTGE